jgi:REP element-mobilizing transposase RayT
MSKLEYKEFYRTGLPHYQPEGAVFAISFRLAFSLPQKVIERLKEEKAVYESISEKLTGEEKKNYAAEFKRKYFEDFDSFIDKYQSDCDWLRMPEISEIVKNGLLFLNKKMYLLHVFTIMPNHLHIILEPAMKNDRWISLAKIMHSIKGYTATKCNNILGRKGQFWQHGHYDHAIRNEKDYYYQINYIKDNPVKAGLVKYWEDWESFVSLVGQSSLIDKKECLNRDV